MLELGMLDYHNLQAILNPRTLGANAVRTFLSLPWVLGSNLWCEPLATILRGPVSLGAFVPDQWVGSA